MTDKKLILYRTRDGTYDGSSSYALRYSDSKELHRRIYVLDSGNNYYSSVISDSNNSIVSGIDMLRGSLGEVNKQIYEKARDLGEKIASEEGLEFADETKDPSQGIVDFLLLTRENEPMVQS